MLIALILITCLTAFVDALLEKWGVWIRFFDFAASYKYRWLFQLASCQFCQRFWIGLIICVVWAFLFPVDELYLLLPFCVSGALKIAKI